MQLMLEKMDSISKELEKRDTLLAQAEVRAKVAEEQAKAAEEQAKQSSRLEQPSSSGLAPADSQNMHLHSNNNPSTPVMDPLLPNDLSQLPHSNLANWEDEDIYMGDNEADKLKEEKMRRKAAKKWKAPQREDEHTDDDDDIESDKDKLEEERKHTKVVQKGKAQQKKDGDSDDSDITIESDGDEMIDIDLDDDDDIVVNMVSVSNRTRSELLSSFSKDRSSSSFVHPPYKFSKPKGGAGPRLRAEPSQIQPDKDGRPSHTSNTASNPLGLAPDALAALTRTILGVMQQDNIPMPRRKPSRKIVSEKIKQPTVRETGTRRKELGVRKVSQKTSRD